MFKSKNFLEQPDNPEIIWEQKQRQFFSRFAREHWDKFQLHHQSHLMPKGERKRDKDPEGAVYISGNPSMHCLVEAAAVDSIKEDLQRAFGFSEQEVENLVLAGLLHDFGKRNEIKAGRDAQKSGLDTSAAFERAHAEDDRILADAKVPEEVMKINAATGHYVIEEMIQLLKRKDSLDNTEKLKLIFHLLDNITAGNNIVSLDKRMNGLINASQKPVFDPQTGNILNKEQSRYYELNESGRAKFRGKGSYEMDLEVSKEIEAWLSSQLGFSEQGNIHEYILDKINQRIAKEQV